MSNKNAPKVQFNFVEEQGSDDLPDHAIGIDASSDEDFGSYEEELSMPTVVEKPKPVSDDIFEAKKQIAKVVAEVNDVDEVADPVNEETGEINPQFVYEEPPAERTKKEKPVKQKKPRKPMTEEHKAKLALAREKAMTVRKAKALERKQMKEIDKETTNLRKKKKMKEFEQLKTEVNEDIPQQQKTVVNNTASTFSKKDLEDAQLEAITKYEILRKARKEEKKKQQALDNQRKELMNKINPPARKYRDGSNRWDICY
tara:strand:+ start:9342 stop:10112 length:771 start_codon:yes stop_codon:yes gene_type:complete